MAETTRTSGKAGIRDGLRDEIARLAPLPVPHCTYADHSYPAFTARQMFDYAAAVLAAFKATGDAKP